MTSETGETGPIVRPKRPSDVEGSVAGLREVHEHDGYPRDWPQDPAAWLQPDRTLAAWVAAVPVGTGPGHGTERVVGHVVLRRPADHHDGKAVAAAGVDPAALAVIARLWVLPSARGRGTARRLLAAAAGDARARGLWPVLDVVSLSAEAIALYESEGWVRVGSQPVAFADGETTELHHYLGPLPTGGGATPDRGGNGLPATPA